MKRLLLALFVFFGLQQAALAASCSSYPFTLQNNTTADATQVMANFTAVRNCVINNAAGSGVNTDITSITGMTTPLSVAQGGSSVFIGGTSAGAANAQTVASTNPTGYSLTTGYRVTFTAGFTNTTTATLNVNSTGATAIRRIGAAGLEALTGSEIVAGNIVEAVYNGTYFVLLSSYQANFNTLTTLASATPDLGTVPSHNVSISGVTAITSFGSTAVTTAPIYLIKFQGALTLTYNATSLIIPGAANITTAANDTAVVEYLGSGNWQVLSYTRASGAAVVSNTPMCGALGLTLTNNSGTPNTNVDYAASSATLLNSSNVPLYGTSISGTINATTGLVTSTADGMDGEARPTSAWGFIYLISDGTNFKGLMGTSATAPTMPTGYTYKCRVGAAQFDGSQNAYRFLQTGNWNLYKVTAATNTLTYWALANGAQGTWSATAPVLTAVTVRGNARCAPSTASQVRIVAYTLWKAGVASNMLTAPSTGWGGANTGPQGTNGAIWPQALMSTAAGSSGQVDLLLEADTIAIASDASGAAWGCAGYKDAVNAN